MERKLQLPVLGTKENQYCLCLEGGAWGQMMKNGMPIDNEAGLRAERFKAAVLAHIDSVYRFALYMAGNESDAQNLVRNTYLRAYKSLGRLEEGMDLKARLLSILSSKFVNTIYGDRRHTRMQSPDNGDSEDEVLRGLLDDHVVAAMSKLPVGYRAVVLLADIEELSYKEIADIVGCPIGAVVSRLCEGRKLLGRILQSHNT